ncbi:hypothetical protein Y032_0422g1190 [Ancylostoma ceylanicum]|uniref:Uncharacterized protein n=1 Tax=Ancylostoma ceylanicum TaxID=53326 RepID=A0A016X2Z2_9BILA|nr:hypothetical protein Y032_0422g1190 [Ancylostoma ceylanicum]
MVETGARQAWTLKLRLDIVDGSTDRNLDERLKWNEGYLLSVFLRRRGSENSQVPGELGHAERRAMQVEELKVRF